MEFMMAIMGRLLEKPEMSMSEVVYEQYHATLAQWHGFWASSAFNVSSRDGSAGDMDAVVQQLEHRTHAR
jgi:hypothetical protein